MSPKKGRTAFYQRASAAMDWTLRWAMKNEAIFNHYLTESSVIAATVSNYFFGIRPITAINKAKTDG
jgi:hypothetical protein